MEIITSSNHLSPFPLLALLVPQSPKRVQLTFYGHARGLTMGTTPPLKTPRISTVTSDFYFVFAINKVVSVSETLVFFWGVLPLFLTTEVIS